MSAKTCTETLGPQEAAGVVDHVVHRVVGIHVEKHVCHSFTMLGEHLFAVWRGDQQT